MFRFLMSVIGCIKSTSLADTCEIIIAQILHNIRFDALFHFAGSPEGARFLPAQGEALGIHNSTLKGRDTHEQAIIRT
jgi:hypothetical protein